MLIHNKRHSATGFIVALQPKVRLEKKNHAFLFWALVLQKQPPSAVFFEGKLI
jgi:hypothetical protein